MDFSEKDFKRMKYNVRGIDSDEDILKKVPDLAGIPEFSELSNPHNGLLRTEIIKYILFMYDPNTPVNTVPDVMKRKFYAATLAGLPKKNSVRFTEEVEAMLGGSDTQVNEAICAFITRLNSAKYTKLVVYNTALELQLKAMLSGKYKTDAIEVVDALERGISDILRQISNEDSSKFTVDAIYDKVRSEKLELRPEDIADKLANGENPVDISPYGENYDFPDNQWTNIKLLADIPEKKK